jgi:hypothetical protein
MAKRARKLPPELIFENAASDLSDDETETIIQELKAQMLESVKAEP